MDIVFYFNISESELMIRWEMAADNPDLQSYAEQYFSSHSFLNKKILRDISDIRHNYQQSWSSVNTQEHEKIINDNLVNPSVQSFYSKVGIIFNLLVDFKQKIHIL